MANNRKASAAEVVCPSCGHRFRLSDEVTAHIQSEAERRTRQRIRHELRGDVEQMVRREFEDDLRAKDEALEQKDRKLRRVEDKLREATRRVVQGPAQELGVVRQATLEEVLTARCPADVFRAVAIGRAGADLVQLVRDQSGRACGSILWESKRGYRNWSEAWVRKLAADQRRERSDIAVIVTEVLPKDANGPFIDVGGVLACTMDVAPYLATILRSRVVAVAAAQGARVRRDDLKGVVYDYVSGPLVERVRAIIGNVVRMRATLARERRAKAAEWSQREGEIDGIELELAGMYGDLRGLGASMPVVGELQMPGSEAVALPAVAQA